MTGIATVEQAYDFLLGRLNFERLPGGKYAHGDFKLSRMQRLLEAVGNPQWDVPCVHIAGTKGKGSTATMLAAILSATGAKIGLFTSPHVERFEERISIDGVNLPETELIELSNELERAIGAFPNEQQPTFFELTTALGWLYFRRKRVRLAVVEVGMGGRLDSTNLCCPVATVITNVSRDHTQVLGETPAEIAREKAGIIKSGIPVFSAVLNPAAQEVVRRVAAEHAVPMFELDREIVVRNSVPRHLDSTAQLVHYEVSLQTPWRSHDSLVIPLAGQHQVANGALAVSVADYLNERELPVSVGAIRDGLRTVQLPLRLEVLRQQPLVIGDAAHNEASIAALTAALQELECAGSRILIFAASKDKDVSRMLQLLRGQFDRVIITQYRSNPRATPLEDLQSMACEILNMDCLTAQNPTAAWELASSIATPRDLICVTGSFFVSAEIRGLLTNSPALAY